MVGKMKGKRWESMRWGSRAWAIVCGRCLKWESIEEERQAGMRGAPEGSGDQKVD